jgi:hypothetical protein
MEKGEGGFFRILGKIVIGVIIAAVIALAVGALVMVLWNWLMPEIFGLGTITYWQGFGLALLLRLLVGGFGEGHGSGGRPHSPRRVHRGERFDDVYEQWWESEGAQRFEQHMRQREKKKSRKPGARNNLSETA